jgi:hypothetical protein
MVDLTKLRENLTVIGFKESEHELYLIDKDNNKCILANIPREYGEYPKIIPINGPSFFRTVDLDVIIMYFQGIIMDSQIKHIDGIPPFIEFSGTRCTHCKTYINKDNFLDNAFKDAKKCNSNSFYYCKDCLTAMCPMCHEETNVEIAFKNKANLAKFYKRLPQVLKCIKQHRMIYMPSTSMVSGYYCDVCNEIINIYHGFNTEDSNISLYSFGKNRIQWYQNRNTDFDMCMNCADKPEHQPKIKENNLEVIPFIPIMAHIGFGSILDWLPIYVSNSGEFVLCNMNKESEHYQKIAYCMNNDGYQIYTLDDRYNLNDEIDIIKMNDRIKNCKNYNNTINIFNIRKAQNESLVFSNQLF